MARRMNSCFASGSGSPRAACCRSSRCRRSDRVAFRAASPASPARGRRAWQVERGWPPGRAWPRPARRPRRCSAAESWMCRRPAPGRRHPLLDARSGRGPASRARVSSCRAAVSTPIFMNWGSKGATGKKNGHSSSRTAGTIRAAEGPSIGGQAFAPSSGRRRAGRRRAAPRPTPSPPSPPRDGPQRVGGAEEQPAAAARASPDVAPSAPPQEDEQGQRARQVGHEVRGGREEIMNVDTWASSRGSSRGRAASPGRSSRPGEDGRVGADSRANTRGRRRARHRERHLPLPGGSSRWSARVRADGGEQGHDRGRALPPEERAASAKGALEAASWAAGTTSSTVQQATVARGPSRPSRGSWPGGRFGRGPPPCRGTVADSKPSSAQTRGSRRRCPSRVRGAATNEATLSAG